MFACVQVLGSIHLQQKGSERKVMTTLQTISGPFYWALANIYCVLALPCCLANLMKDYWVALSYYWLDPMATNFSCNNNSSFGSLHYASIIGMCLDYVNPADSPNCALTFLNKIPRDEKDWKTLSGWCVCLAALTLGHVIWVGMRDASDLIDLRSLPKRSCL